MATLTYGPGLSLDGGQADNSLTGVGDTLGNFNFLTFSTETASQAIGDYRRLNNPVLQNIFNGNGFTYSPSGVPTGGNITEFKVLFNGALFSDLTSISVPVVTLEAWVAKGQYALAGATIFAGDDTTDEVGFSAVQSIGGLGIKVGAGSSLAALRCASPAHLRQWLQSTASGARK